MRFTITDGDWGMEGKHSNEIQELSHLTMVTTLTAFSVLLITLNLLMGWDKWTIPICICAMITAIVMHVSHKPQEDTRIYIYAVILLVELFYYCVNVETVYDSAPVIIVILIVLAMTQKKVLTGACIFVGYSGMIYHVVAVNGREGLNFELMNIVRTGWHFILVGIAAAVVIGLMNAVVQMTDHYTKEIETLQGVNKSASDFLANVSHEIRTPVNAIIGLTGICMEKEKDAAIKRDLLSVERAGRRVHEQISDILDYSEIDMGNLSVNEEEYMLSSILNDLMSQVRPIKPRELELVIDVDPALPLIMYSDAFKLKKILWHLIANGLKYTQEGGVYVRISSVPQNYGINLCIEVTDTGIGMGPEEMERISERFYQANSGRTRSTSGLGLGMAIVSGFVFALHGFMQVESELGKGTSVHVSIPQKVIDPSECMSVKNREKLSLGAFLHFEKFAHAQVREFYDSMLLDLVSGLKVKMHKVETVENLKKLVQNLQLTHLFVGEEEYLADVSFMEEIAKEILVVIVANEDFRLKPGSHARIMEKPFYCFPVIGILNSDINAFETEGRLTCPGVHALVVDDEPMNLMVARGIFQRYGMTVSVAESGMQAIEMCRQNAYDIVFMDHMMPGMDGVEAMKRIRTDALRGKRDLPIIALTANAVSTAKEMFISEGFDGFVSKPVELTELERVMKKVLPPNVIVYVKDGECLAENTGESKTGETTFGTEKSQKTDLAASGTGESKTAGAGEKLGNEETFEDRLSEYGINVQKGLHYCQGDVSLYRELLIQFAKDAPEKYIKTNAYLQDKAYGDYAVIVHAIKSTSKMIGEDDLSEKSRMLEMAAKEGKGEVLMEAHSGMMAEYVRIAEGIAQVCGIQIKFESQDDNSDVAVLEFDPEDDVDQDTSLEFEPKGGDGE